PSLLLRRRGLRHAVEMALERIDMRRPELAELPEPRIDLLQRLRPQPVETALRAHGGFDETGVAQHPQVLRHRRLRQPKPLLDLPDGLLRRSEQAQDRATMRLGDGLEHRLHIHNMLHSVYTGQRIFMMSRWVPVVAHEARKVS